MIDNVIFFRLRTGMPDCEKANRNCKECFKATIEWLLQECKEPILTNEGIGYVKHLIETYNIGKAISIRLEKRIVEHQLMYTLCIRFANGELATSISKRNFYDMFQYMEIDKNYLPEELGLC